MSSGVPFARSSAPIAAELGRWCAFVAAFLLLAQFARLLAFEIRDTGLVVFWPPAGLALAVFVRTPYTHWWKPLVALLVANLTFDFLMHGASPHMALVFWIGNGLGCMAGAAFLKQCDGCDFSMESVRDAAYLLIGGVLVTPAVTALTLTFLRDPVQSGHWNDVFRAFLGIGLGVLLFAPLILAWSVPAGAALPKWTELNRRRLAEATVGAAISLAMAEFLFDYPGEKMLETTRYPFWLFLPVIWAGVRFPPRYAYLLIMGTMLLAIANTAAGRGPFTAPQQPVENRILLVQGLVAVMALTTVSLAASMTQRRKAEAALSESREVLQSFFDEANDLIAWICPDGRLLSANRAWQESLGFEGSEIAKLNLRDILSPESQGAHDRAWKYVTEGTESAVVESVLRSRDGHDILVETSITAYRSNGKVDHFREVSRDITHRREHEQERERLIEQLQTALAEVKTLRGLIPICSCCKKIRTEAGAWQELEEYLSPRMEGAFTHGLCVECGRKQFGPYWEEVAKDAEKKRGEDKPE